MYIYSTSAEAKQRIWVNRFLFKSMKDSDEICGRVGHGARSKWLDFLCRFGFFFVDSGFFTFTSSCIVVCIRQVAGHLANTNNNTILGGV